MARKLRIESAGAIYHVLNRGNYRGDVFAHRGARQAFLQCLEEACRKTGWILHAWAVMRNHYHLALETPAPNLVDGMGWLQTTFCARFNRYRSENGHVFQGRYKALPVARGPSLGALCHYIHLNPVAAEATPMSRLRDWPWGSFRALQHPAARPAWFNPRAALTEPCALDDTDAGRRSYAEYLAWLATDEVEKKRLGFDRMATDWALGPKEFKEALLQEARHRGASLPYGSSEMKEARELDWAVQLARLRAQLPTGADSPRGKSADWKVALATVMKDRTTASNPWLAGHLLMGAPSMLSRLAAECRASLRAVSLYRLLSSIR
ncbi:MAG TPA: transposase [Bryobacteraceae bacterium]|nr:transposase [Bryobacteraceae bacterium]